MMERMIRLRLLRRAAWGSVGESSGRNGEDSCVFTGLHLRLLSAYGGVVRFEFAFEKKYLPALAAIGVTPLTARVEVDGEALDARFGPWHCRTPIDNITCVKQTGPYSAIKAIGARGSLSDRGATFGTTSKGGVCVEFRKPVRILDPSGNILHPGLTLTVSDRDAFEKAVREAAGLPAQTG
jgi:hypothetical protein